MTRIAHPRPPRRSDRRRAWPVAVRAHGQFKVGRIVGDGNAHAGRTYFGTMIGVNYDLASRPSRGRSGRDDRPLRGRSRTDAARRRAWARSAAASGDASMPGDRELLAPGEPRSQAGGPASRPTFHDHPSRGSDRLKPLNRAGPRSSRASFAPALGPARCQGRAPTMSRSSRRIGPRSRPSSDMPPREIMDASTGDPLARKAPR